MLEEYQAERLDIRDDFPSAYERLWLDQPSLVELAISINEFGGIVDNAPSAWSRWIRPRG